MTDLPKFYSTSRQMIRRLVDHFYDAIRRDDKLGPVFDRVIDDDWEPHLDKMVDFWMSVMFKTGAFKGRPMIVHRGLDDLRPEHFPLWLELFRDSAKSICPTNFASEIIHKAELIAGSLQNGVFPAAEEGLRREARAA